MQAVAARARAEGVGAAEVLALVARTLAAGTPVSGPLGAVDPAALDLPEPPSAAPELLGALHEVLVAPADRRRRGVHYTPPALAASLVGVALALPGPAGQAAAPTVCDPSCGGGAFLLAAARALRAGGVDPRTVVAGCLRGVDVDPLAVAVTRASLGVWARAEGMVEPPEARVVVGDALVDPWPGPPPDLVVGNPPFAGQLASGTARRGAADAAGRALLGRRTGYADTAGLFLVRALDEVVPGGVVALVQPQSLLAARDAGAVRAAVGERGDLVELWVAGDRVFQAGVHVCAPIVRRKGAAPPVRRPSVVIRRGADLRPVGTVPAAELDGDAGWAPAWARAEGVPPVILGRRPTVGEWCDTSAGFRDEFYAVAPLVDEVDAGSAEGVVRLVTSGLVDPGRCAWGERATKVAGRRLTAPGLTPAVLERAGATDPRVRAWAARRLVPKVVVATQTPVVEAAVDDEGSWWPSVPVISVVCARVPDDAEHRWLVAAALLAPPVTAWALARAGGTALGPRSIKLSARQVATVPLPSEESPWREAAAGLAAAARDGGPDDDALLAAGELLTRAHGLSVARGRELLAWWSARLPGRR